MKSYLSPVNLIFFSTFLLLGCSKSVDFDFPAHAPGLVLNGVFNPDSIFSIDLTSSNQISSNNDFNPVENASVRLFQNGNYLTDLQHSKKGIYRASIKPESLRKYEIRVTAPGFPDIAAHNHVPEKPAIHHVQITTVSGGVSPTQGLNVSLILDDVPKENNFYFIRAYTFDRGGNAGMPYIRDLNISFISPIEDDFEMGSRKFFSDKLFQGDSINLKIHLEDSSKETVYLLIAQVTKEYFDYGKTLRRHTMTDLNINQMAVSNNIENGVGLFAGYNAVTIPIKH